MRTGNRPEGSSRAEVLEVLRKSRGKLSAATVAESLDLTAATVNNTLYRLTLDKGSGVKRERADSRHFVYWIEK